MVFKINKSVISKKNKTYFIADIAANHNGNIDKAIELINIAKQSGANAAKFQHFHADTIVSRHSFDRMKKLGHQSKWKKSVYQVYKEASLNLNWTRKLYNECKKINIDFFTSPYSIELVDHVDRFVSAYKIGSGDITYSEIVEYISKKKKPVILATGASSITEVERAIKIIKKFNKNICIMQCNTNYTGSKENFNYINLNVLTLFKERFKDVILGLSDHTPGHSTVLGAVALGARIIEKHFTLSNKSAGPDHKFSMTPNTWEEMVERTRELELAMGSKKKLLEKNEKDSVIVQRRSVHLNKSYKKNEKIKIKDVSCLRPSPHGSVQPYELKKIKSRFLKVTHEKGDILYWKDLK
jgi:N-acetylneuraminate synthase